MAHYELTIPSTLYLDLEPPSEHHQVIKETYTLAASDGRRAESGVTFLSWLHSYEAWCYILVVALNDLIGRITAAGRQPAEFALVLKVYGVHILTEYLDGFPVPGIVHTDLASIVAKLHQFKRVSVHVDCDEFVTVRIIERAP